MLQDESLSCETDLGYPSTNTLILQSNKDGEYVTVDDVFGLDKTRNEEECNVTEIVTVKSFSFDDSWNNTKLRCVIAYENGTLTTYISEAITIQLISGKQSAFSVKKCIIMLMKKTS